MRRAQQCRIPHAVSAVLASLAPHDSKARLIAVTNRRRFMAKPCTPHPIAQRVQLFEIETANVGGRGEHPSSFSGGSKGGILFEKRIPPFTRSPKVLGEKCSTTYKWSISARSTVCISSRCRKGRDRCGRSSGPCGAAFSPCRRRRWRRRCRRPRARA